MPLINLNSYFYSKFWTLSLKVELQKTRGRRAAQPSAVTPMLVTFCGKLSSENIINKKCSNFSWEKRFSTLNRRIVTIKIKKIKRKNFISKLIYIPYCKFCFLFLVFIIILLKIKQGLFSGGWRWRWNLLLLTFN